MDKISIFGVLLGLTAVILGQILEGGHVASLMQATAFLIVTGGTLGAVMLQTRQDHFIAGVKMVKWVFIPPQHDFKKQLGVLLNWSQQARRGGLLALEAYVQSEKDIFVKRALQMVVDGAEPEVIRRAMELDIDSFEDRARSAAKIWEAAGGYSPTIGIIGAVMGLIHVMENLTDPSKLGAGIAVAFVATIYGVAMANLLFLPIAHKLKQHIQTEIKRREMLLEGLVAIANGENPRVLENKLAGFLP
ncbi:flagellar motor protein [Iodobacter fluviatilis]|jgi:chemotaxis protein MotA|uniref:Flagellar motor protein n=1 Tax=Iodobacter fluviatilis TaxID=537 RepID=A0A7G3G9E8_9NEIS|nr:flagellar motor protein [Iodobacter fluviatilis]QBC44130.1 flagellar motor protein [Iodobacter fluviatilis]